MKYTEIPIEELEKLANEKDEKALNELGNRAYYGINGVDKNLKLSVEYYKKAMELGSIKGKFSFAYLILICDCFGIEIDYNCKLAHRYFIELYEKEKDMDSLSVLTIMYYWGIGVEKNYQKALEYGLLLEDKNNDKANFVYYFLGKIYKEGGDGIKKNKKKYQYYFSKIQRDFLRAMIYQTIAVYDNEEKYKSQISCTLNFGKKYADEIYKIIEDIRKNHPAVLYYNRLKIFDDEMYQEIVNDIKPKVLSFFEKESYKVLDTFESEDDVDKFVEVLLSNK